MDILQRMASFTATMSLASLAPSSIVMAKSCLLDTYGVALMGSRQEDAQKLLHALHEFCNAGHSRVWGTQYTLPPPMAALSNAFNAHVLDYDDSCYAGMTHPSAVLFPTILALADTYGADGKDVLAALVAGWEIMGRLGLALPNLLEEGWQCGSLFGGVGAAAAGARLLRLNSEETLHAISLVLCQIGGLRQSNGSRGKPFTLGKAAENAVTACLVARAGIQGSKNMLEGPEGYFKVFAKNTQLIELLASIGNPLIIDSHKVCVKRHPICSSAHAAVEAAETLIHQHALEPSAIAAVHCATTRTALRYLIYHNPRSSVEAQFSLPYLVAATLVDGRFNSQTHLQEEALHRHDIRQIMRTITWEAKDTLGPDHKTENEHPEAACITVTTTDGRRFSHYVGDPLGFPAAPLSRAHYTEKFAFCTKDILSPQEQGHVVQRIFALETMPFSKDFSAQLHG